MDSEECACICVFYLIVCIWNYVSTSCTLNNLVNAYAALMRANKPETVSIVLILTVCSSHLYTYLYEHYSGSSATPRLAISRVYIGGRDWVMVINAYLWMIAFFRWGIN